MKKHKLLLHNHKENACENQLKLVWHYPKQNDKMIHHMKMTECGKHLGCLSKTVYGLTTVDIFDISTSYDLLSPLQTTKDMFEQGLSALLKCSTK